MEVRKSIPPEIIVGEEDEDVIRPYRSYTPFPLFSIRYSPIDDEVVPYNDC
jgi:hypothetical protein